MKKLLLIDGHSLIHRAYHAYPKTLATSMGELTNAVYGFTNIFLTAISELTPTHVAVAFDLPKPTFREAIFVGYKQSRVKPDDDMIVQIPRIKEVVEALNIPIFEVAGYEADDVIGTLAREATEKMAEIEKSVKSIKGKEVDNSNPLNNLSPSLVVILTSDRDLMQLIVDDCVVVKMPERGTRFKRTVLATQGPSSTDIWNEERFIAEWGFKPNLLPDYKAFAGDQSDDIPGVKGIGEKTAKHLVSTLGSVNDIYEHLSDVPEKIVKKLAEDQESAQMSKKLATIDTHVPIQFNWRAMEVHEYDKGKVLKLFEKFQFKSLVNKLPNDQFEQQIQEALF